MGEVEPPAPFVVPEVEVVSEKKSKLQLVALGPGGRPIPAWLEPWQRAVFWFGGTVGRGVPIVVRYRRTRGAAWAVRRKLKRWRYRCVTTQCTGPKETSTATD